MAKILYVTNCIGGGISSWNDCKSRVASKFKTKLNTDIAIPKHVGRSPAHYLAEFGNEVYVYSPEFYKQAPEISLLGAKALFHKNIKILEHKDIRIWTQCLSSSSGRGSELMPWVNLLIMPELNNIICFKDFDIVLYDSWFENMCLPRKEWHQAFTYSRLSQSGFVDVIKNSVPIDEILTWLDTSRQTDETKILKEKKPLISPDSARKLKSKLEDIPNLFLLNNAKLWAKAHHELLNGVGSNNVEQAIECLFPITECGRYAFHSQQFIPIDRLNSLSQIVRSRKEKRVHKETFLDHFETDMIKCKDTLPHFNLSDNYVPFKKPVTVSNYLDYGFGCTKVTNKGCKEQADYIDDMAFGLNHIKPH